MATGKAKNFSPSNKGIQLENIEGLDDDESWFTVEEGAWSFIEDIDKGDKIGFSINSDGNIVYIDSDGNDPVDDDYDGESRSQPSSNNTGEIDSDAKDQLDQIEKYVAKNYDENKEMLKGLVESVSMLREDVDTIKEALEIEEIEQD